MFCVTSPRLIWDENKNLSNRRKHGLGFETDGLAVVPVAHTFTEGGSNGRSG